MKIIILLTLLIVAITAHKMSSHNKAKHTTLHSDDGDNVYTSMDKPHPDQKNSYSNLSQEKADSNVHIPTLAQAKSMYESKAQSTSQYYNIPGWWGDEWFEDYDPLCQWISDDQIEGLTMSCHCFGAWEIGGNMNVARNQCMFENCFLFTGKVIECYECVEGLKSMFNYVATNAVFHERPETSYLADCEVAALILEDQSLGEQYGYRPLWDYDWN